MARMKNPLIHLNDIKVRNKMLLLYIFSVIIPIIFTNLVFYRKISHSVGEREMQYIAQDMQKIKGTLNVLSMKTPPYHMPSIPIKSLYFSDRHYENSDEYFFTIFNI